MNHNPKRGYKTVKNMDGLNVDVIDVAPKYGGIGWIGEYTARNGVLVFTVEAAAEKGTICLGVYVEDELSASEALEDLRDNGDMQDHGDSYLSAERFLKLTGEWNVGDALLHMTATEYMNRNYGWKRNVGYYDWEIKGGDDIED